MLELKLYETKLKQICSNFNLKRLDLFGSAVTDKFGPNSDIDIIIEFNIQKEENLFNKYFLLKEELFMLFNRPIDIIIEKSIRNPFLMESINSTRKNIYVA